MAKSPKEKKEPLTDLQRENLVDVLNKLAAPMLDEILLADGTPTATVLLPNGEYRHKPLFPGQELMFKGFYLTKTGAPTAILEPVDSCEWQRAEFDLKKLDVTFPIFGASLANAHELGELESMEDVYRAMIEKVTAEKAAKAKAILEESANQNDQNPLWGRFG